MPTRFVILHHQLHGGEHWDLMLEHGDTLLTWQLLRRPTPDDTVPIPAKRIGNHRKHYLDYEGPVSGDRGHVTRIEGGTVTLHDMTDDHVTFALNGGRFVGMFALTRSGDEWLFTRSPAD